MLFSPSSRSLGRWLAAAVALLLVLPVPARVHAHGAPQEELPEELPDWAWPVEVEAPIRTFFEREDVEAIAELTSPPDADVAGSVTGLAATLGADVSIHFRYVQRRIAYEPYAGSIRGAAGALRSGGGNALDQALLLRELLVAAGHRARLVLGRLGWARAEQLAGERPGARPARGDPWLRRVEAASDHWWVQVRQGGSWTSLDPAFRDATLGDEFGRRGEAVEEVPSRWVASVRIELVAANRRLAGVVLPMPELFGSAVHVALARPMIEEVDAEPTVDPVIESAGLPAAEDLDTTDSDQLVVHDPLDPAPIHEALRDIPPGPVSLEIRAAGRAISALPVAREQLADVRLLLDVEVPPGRHVQATLPFGSDPLGHLTVVLAGGAVRPAAYASQVNDLYSTMDQLLATELTALEAWRLRPREEEADDLESESDVDRTPAPALPAFDTEELEEEPLVHPAVALHVEAIRAWQSFSDHGTEAIGLALLAAADRVSRATPVQRPDVRLVALNYRPASASSPGELTVWLADPIQVGGSSSPARVATQSALGFLQSAIAGQVLNRLADRPPLTAYDLTLRAVGSGRRLSWFERPRGPATWPAAATAVATDDLSRGSTVVGPERPLQRGGVELLAWWALGDSGQASGRVSTPLGIAQASVEIGPPTDSSELGSILASLHDLHVAVGWLLTLGEADSTTLTDLVPGACAATSLVADLLRAGAPGDFVAPAFATFCRIQASS